MEMLATLPGTAPGTPLCHACREAVGALWPTALCKIGRKHSPRVASPGPLGTCRLLRDAMWPSRAHEVMSAGSQDHLRSLATSPSCCLFQSLLPDPKTKHFTILLSETQWTWEMKLPSAGLRVFLHLRAPVHPSIHSANDKYVVCIESLRGARLGARICPASSVWPAACAPVARQHCEPWSHHVGNHGGPTYKDVKMVLAS